MVCLEVEKCLEIEFSLRELLDVGDESEESLRAGNRVPANIARGEKREKGKGVALVFLCYPDQRQSQLQVRVHPDRHDDSH